MLGNRATGRTMGRISRGEPLVLDLTGPTSHTVHIEAGQGSFALGPVGMKVGKLDAVVAPDAAINWAAFDGMTGPAGYPWPRFFYYQGNDIGFAAWSYTRHIENFTWLPSSAERLDVADARIGQLSLHLAGTPLDLVLGGIHDLSIAGDLSGLNVRCDEGRTLPSLAVAPVAVPRSQVYTLPSLSALAGISRLSISVDALAAPFDCESLLQFSSLQHLQLEGNMTNLPALAQLPELQDLALRFCPNLTGLPELETFRKLTSFIGWNIEARSGKALRGQLRKLEASGRVKNYSSVAKLRAPAWFVTEYRLPFATWPRKRAAQASKAHKQAAAAIAEARSIEAVQTVVVAFVEVINTLPNIETSEREDVGVGIDRLAALAPMGVPPDVAQGWFDAVRDF
jgi:hypothetical protein